MTEILVLVVGAVLLGAVVVSAVLLPQRVAEGVRGALADRLTAVEAAQARVEATLRGELATSRSESGQRLDALRNEQGQRLDALRDKVDARLRELQEGNEKRLEKIRETVDEKLQGTLERRLGESFKLVSERLEAVQKGLGEMQSLATGVGDLRKVLSNVKVRGIWGEVQLGALLEQVLAPEQFAVNVATRKGTQERVEFAIRLPGKGEGEGEVLLPIDSKFPLEDYQRLVEGSERGDAQAVTDAGNALQARIEGCAAQIRDKYLNPPTTTDFGVLFLPTESLYAEVVRRPGLVERLQRDYKVSVAGPTTLLAMLNSLQMGFRTLAIQKRSSEVWQVLGAVKTEFGKFGEVLDKVEKKLQEASNQIRAVETRKRVIERTLKDVTALPAAEAAARLPGAGAADDDGEEPA